MKNVLFFVALIALLALVLAEKKQAKTGATPVKLATRAKAPAKSAPKKKTATKVTKTLKKTPTKKSAPKKTNKPKAPKKTPTKKATTKPVAVAASANGLKQGDMLHTIASAVNIRSGPCTSAGIVKTVAQNTNLKFTGSAQKGCGYTWYAIHNQSFGKGFVASKYVKKGHVAAPKTPKPVKPDTPVKNGKYPLYKQCDSKWGSHRLGSSTVCRIGCLMSSVSMALAGLGKHVAGQASNPGTLNQYLSTHHGYSGNLFNWGAVAPLGLRYQGQTRDKAKMKADLHAGKIVILNVRSGGHWVLATGHSGSSFTVNDPGFSVSSYSDSQVGLAGIFSH